MSSVHRQYFTPNDLRMLERVLDHAGIYNSANDGDQNLRLSAAKFLFRSFQAGIIDEHNLYAVLVDNLVRMRLLSKSLTVARITLLAAGDRMAIGTRNGYRFGEKVTKLRPSSDDRLFGHCSGSPPVGGMIVEDTEQVPQAIAIAPASVG